ncbi:hypothetical protein SDC9_87101 [bioreactor metagenome]|uniref:M23ase beta-sheet core domain-containing protein n=1 Tax=bioreactor metagenome TaxID=1076179 RepID=A0A644ZIA4_9ZZZZ
MRSILAFVFITISFSALTQVSSNAYPPMKTPLQLTSNFAEYRKNHFHSGIDIGVRNRTDMSVFSIWDGYVSRVRFNSASYGRAVYITHPNGYTSVYGHLDSFAPFIDSLVTRYQYQNKVFETDIEIPAGTVPVKKGQVIGIAGNSGYSFGAHLHFEIRDASTEEPVNPLKFIPVDDLQEPQFKQIAVFQMQQGLFLPAKGTYYNIVKSGKIYTTTAEIVVPDTFFLGFNIQDYQSYAYYRLLPQTIDMLIDDSLVWQIEFNRFSFDQSGACRGVFDHAAGLKDYRQVVLTYTGNHLRQRFYKKYSNDGLFILPDHERHKLTVKATDTEFNTSVFSTTIKKSTSTSKIPAEKNIIRTGYFHDFSTEHLALSCDTGTFFADLALAEPLLTESGSGNNMVWKIGFDEIPLIKPMHVYFLPSAMPDEKTLFAKTTSKGIDKVWKPVSISDGRMGVDIDRPGTFVFFRDTIAPVIAKTTIPASRKLTWQKEIVLIVADNSGEFSKYNAYINGEWTLMIYDLKSDSFTIPLSTEKKSKLTDLKVEFTDLAGNTTIREYSFLR